ncbi:MAG: CoA pyrophosphatase [Anaerolineae bacterium]|nr:CoA pyrophosphatase [Anaerolineae bacterium]
MIANNTNTQSRLMDNHPLFLHKLHAALHEPLPGLAAQLKMAAPDRVIIPEIGAHPRQAAIIIILYPLQKELMVLFTRRTQMVSHHRGQICFPGGRIEENETVEMAALREAEEELGAPMHHIQILGKLTSLYVSASHNMVHPVIGWLPILPNLTPNPFEVASVLHIPLTALLDTTNQKPYQKRSTAPGERTPCYWIGESCIWGATAMMTSELVEVVNTILGNGNKETGRRTYPIAP